MMATKKTLKITFFINTFVFGLIICKSRKKFHNTKKNYLSSFNVLEISGQKNIVSIFEVKIEKQCNSYKKNPCTFPMEEHLDVSIVLWYMRS